MALPIAPDRGYLNLLGHLRQSRPQLPLETLQAAICHYLVHLPPTQPTPAPLTASVLASRAWHPLSLQATLALGSSFRNAIKLKRDALSKERRGLFQGSKSLDFSRWVKGILGGLKDGDALLVLAIAGGVVLGLQDVSSQKSSAKLVDDAQERVVLAFAEVLDAPVWSSESGDAWEKEFKPGAEGYNERVNLAVLLAAQYFPFVSTGKLNALRLTELALLTLSMIRNAYLSGHFLDGAKESVVSSSTGSLSISRQSSLHEDVSTIITSDAFGCIAPLCKLLSRTIDIISNSTAGSRRRQEYWDLLSNIISTVRAMGQSLEEGWQNSLLSSISDQSCIEPDSREVSGKIWTVIKTFLFSTLMVQQSVLDGILYVPPPRLLYNQSSKTDPPVQQTPSGLCCSILVTLSSISFVIATFGGVTAGASPNADGEGRSFPELKRVFYMAVDILSANASASEEFVEHLIAGIDSNYDHGHSAGDLFFNAKRAYILACVEQFVSVLSDPCIEAYVLPLCEPHLYDPSHRETFESAHSVMLSIFAAHADKPSAFQTKGKEAKENAGKQINLASSLVPGYVKCLLENAKDGKLTTSQFRLAYSALVRSANTGRAPNSLRPHLTGPSYNGLALARLCIEALLEAIALFSPPNMNANNIEEASEETDARIEEMMRLRLALISLTSNVTIQLLPYLLQEVDRIVSGERDRRRKRILIDAVFDEVLERVGDEEKEYAMRWWNERLPSWSEGVVDVVHQV